MIKKKVLSALIASSSVMMAGQSIADLNIYADPNVMTRSAQKSELYSFKQIGTSLERANTVSSGELPLSMAIEYLIPEGWDVRVNNKLNSEPVQWKGNVAWPYALESISENNQMDIVVNWERRYVDIESNAREIESERIELVEFEREFLQQNTESSPQNLLERETSSNNNESNNIEENSNLNLLERESNTSNQENDNQSSESKINKEPSGLLDNPDVLNEIEDNNMKNNSRTIEDLTPSEEFQLRREYQDAYVLPYNDSFESFVKNQNVDMHEYLELTFILKSGMTVQENIREWGRAMPGDWTIVWNANKDFLIEKEIRLKNTFIDVFPVVQGFYENSPYPIELEIYLRNETIRAINKDYKINHSGVR